MEQILLCVLPLRREQQWVVPEGIRVRLLYGLWAPRQYRPLSQPCVGQEYNAFSSVVVSRGSWRLL
jgi:hypothetical protein